MPQITKPDVVNYLPATRDAVAHRRVSISFSVPLVIVACALTLLLSRVGLSVGDEPAPATILPAPIEPPPNVVSPPPPDINAQLQALQTEVEILKQAEAERQKQAADAEPSAKTLFEDRPSFRISSELQLDTYFFGQNTESRDTVGDMPDGTAFRRARIAVLGNYKLTEYRIEMDFAQPGRPTFLDVWGAVNELPVLGQCKIGYFFEPIGLERLTSNRFAPFMERNLPDQPFDPQRNPGVAFQNDHSDNHGIWTIGVFRGRNDSFGDAPANSGDWLLDGRLTWLPWYDEESGGRYYLHFGTANSYRRTLDDTISFRAQPEARLGAADPNVPFFIDTGDITAPSYGIHTVEFACSLGSLYLQAEHYWVPVNQANNPYLLFTGWYVQAGYYLTGEHRPFRRETATFDRVQPFTEFFRVRSRQGVVQGWGAWEVAARLSQADLTSGNIGGGKLTDLTIGLNWYLTPYMRITTNYVHAFLDPAASSRTGADIFGMRMQYEY